MSTFWTSWLFQKYWRCWRVQASKFTKFVRWRDFNAFRRAHVSFQVTRRVVTPKSNIVYTGDCSTKCGRSIRAVSNFDHGFRDRTWCILTTFANRCGRRCLNFIFPKYHGWTLRNERVIRAQAPGSIDRKFGKSWIFPKYWRWWGVPACKFMKFVRWRDFNALRRSHVCLTWLVEWLHP